MTVQVSPEELPVLSEVVLRLARPEERLRWDGLMDEHHYLGSRATESAPTRRSGVLRAVGPVRRRPAADVSVAAANAVLDGEACVASSRARRCREAAARVGLTRFPSQPRPGTARFDQSRDAPESMQAPAPGLRQSRLRAAGRNQEVRHGPTF